MSSAVSIDSASALEHRLQDPAVASSLNTILDHADLLALMVSGLDQFVARSEVISESLHSSFLDLKATDIGGSAESLGALASVLPKLVDRLGTAIEDGTIEKLANVADVAATALPEVQMFAHGLVKGSERFPRDAVEVGGPLSLLKLLKDPDINRALSFVATVAQSIGRELKHQ